MKAVRLRPTLAEVCLDVGAWMVGSFCGVLAGFWFYALRSGQMEDVMFSDALVLAVAMAGLGAGMRLVGVTHTGLDLSRQGVVLRRPAPLTSRCLSWDEIDAISVRRDLGRRLVFFSRGRRVWATYPSRGWGRRSRFDEQVQLVGHYWLENRGSGWQPRPGYYTEGVWREDLGPPPAPA